jgi:cytochrome P450
MTTTKTFALEDVDLTNLDRFVRNEGWAQFDTLRREAPVHWNPEPHGGRGFWSVTRHADIATVDRDAETFTSTKFVNLEDVDDDYIRIRRSILESDGTRHLALRKLIQRDLTGRALLKYRDFLRDLTTVTVNEALTETEFDFVEKISADFPIAVLARLLAVPDSMTGQLIEWGNRIILNTDPEYGDVMLDDPKSEQYKHLPFRSPTSLEVFEYGRQLAAERRGGDGEDLVSRLVNKIPEDGVPLSDNEFDNYFLLLVVAGNESTRHTISHAMHALITNPDQLRWLQNNPDKMGVAVEELIRWASPVYHFRRTATRDVELGGAQIREGDKVVMWFASGNRDETVFDDPYTLDLTRTPNDHVTFGKGGPHFCLGSALARMEITLMFEALLPRIKSIELAGEVTRVRSNFINGIKKFPVRVTPA